MCARALVWRYCAPRAPCECVCRDAGTSWRARCGPCTGRLARSVWREGRRACFIIVVVVVVVVIVIVIVIVIVFVLIIVIIVNVIIVILLLLLCFYNYPCRCHY